jgi:hypothetical protein
MTGRTQPKRKKYGGRKRGTPNKRTVIRQRYDHYLKAKASGIPLAIEVEEELVAWFHDAFHGEKKPSRKLMWARRLHEIAATLLPYQTPKLASVSLVPRNINRDQKVTLRIIDHNRDLIEERDVELPPMITGQGDVVESNRNG